MGAVNRYSREPAIAEFTPLTGAEVMAVPLLKQEMEDGQIAENREVLKDLYSKQAVVKDQERVNAIKADLEGQLQGISEEIATKGISRDRTERFNTLKATYDKETSLQGTIGHADAFQKKEAVAKANFYNSKSAKTWSKNDLDAIWQEHSSQQSAFDGDNFNLEYNEAGLPDYTTIDEELMKMVGVIGQTGERDKDGHLSEDNVWQIMKAKDLLLRKFQDNSTPEGQISYIKKWSPAYLEERVLLAAQAMIKSKEYAPEIAKMTAKQQEDYIYSKEQLFQSYSGEIKGLGLANDRLENTAKLKEMRTAIETANPADREEAERNYNVYRASVRKAEENYLSTAQGAFLMEEKEKARKESGLDETKLDYVDSLDYDNLVHGTTLTYAEYFDELGGKLPYNQAYEHEDEDAVRKEFSISKVFNEEELKKYEEYRKHSTQYDSGLFAAIGKDRAHALQSEFILQPSIYGKSKKNGLLISTYKEKITNIIESSAGDIKILKGITLDGVDLKDLQTTITENNDGLKMLVSNKIATGEIISLVPDNGVGSYPGVRVKIPNDFKVTGIEGETLELVVSLGDGSNQTTRATMVNDTKQLGPGGMALGRSFENSYNFGYLVMTTGDNKDYFNSDQLKNHVQPGGIFDNQIKDTDQIDVFYNKKTKSFNVKSMRNGTETTMTEWDLVAGMTGSVKEMMESPVNKRRIMPILAKIIEENPGFSDWPEDAQRKALAMEIASIREAGEAGASVISLKDKNYILNYL